MAEEVPETLTLREVAGAGRVVVGYDGRWQAPVVLDFAADVAVKLNCPLSIVTLFRSSGDVACLETRPADGWHPQAVIRRTLDDAANHVRQRHPLLRVATHGLTFDAVTGKDEPFCSARLLVLGERGTRISHGVVAGAPPGGGTASGVLRAAITCDVVVVEEAEVALS